jgi:hypothetical protein
MGYEWTEDRAACLCQVKKEVGRNGNGRTCTTDACTSGTRRDNSAIAKCALHPPIQRGYEHSARGRGLAQHFKLADALLQHSPESD